MPPAGQSADIEPAPVAGNQATADPARLAEPATQREQRYRATIECAPAAMVMVDCDGRIVLVNRQTEKLFGYSREELLGQPVEVLVPERFRAEHPQHRRDYLANPSARNTGTGRDLTGLRKDGSEFPVEIGLNPVETGDGLFVVSAIADITERTLVEKTRGYLSAIVESTNDAIMSTSLDGVITSWNLGAERLFGYTAEETIGQSAARLFPAHRDEQAASLPAHLQRRETVERLETIGVRQDATLVDVALTVSPIRLENGQLIGASTIARDITDRKRTEAALRTLNDQLEQRVDELSGSNRELEQFAYVASHDLQEPLRKIASYAQLVREDCAPALGEQGDEYLEIIISAANRLKQLVGDLLAFSRVTTRGQALTATDANQCLQAALDNLQLAIQESGAVVACDPFPAVLADEGQLILLLQNLIGNAIKYRGDAPPSIHVGGRDSAGQFEFSVQDNGIGIESQYHERIFQIFQRLHNRREYSGTGIGLALCRRVVERFGGRIWVESAAGQGSTFYFTLKKTEQEGGPDAIHGKLASTC